MTASEAFEKCLEVVDRVKQTIERTGVPDNPVDKGYKLACDHIKEYICELAAEAEKEKEK